MLYARGDSVFIRQAEKGRLEAGGNPLECQRLRLGEPDTLSAILTRAVLALGSLLLAWGAFTWGKRRGSTAAPTAPGPPPHSHPWFEQGTTYDELGEGS